MCSIVKQHPPPVAVLRGHQEPIQSVCLITDQLLSISHVCELFFWDLQMRRLLRELHKFEETDDGFFRVCADDSVITCNSRLGRVFFYDSQETRLARLK
jgi:hypothetical protein